MGTFSDIIILELGSKQGCPISLLLFALYIEPLAQWIRQTENIKGVCVNGEDHKLALYADDILTLEDCGPGPPLSVFWGLPHHWRILLVLGLVESSLPLPSARLWLGLVSLVTRAAPCSVG